MSILNILTNPNPLLRIEASEILNVDDSVRRLMDDMLKTMYKFDGVGLAAPQIGCSKRILVVDLQGIYIDDDLSVRFKKHKIFDPICIANPRIVEHSSDLIAIKEGCLSLPGKEISVQRFKSIKLEFLDYYNNLVVKNFSGFASCVFQHEIDHLNGKLLIDYL